MESSLKKSNNAKHKYLKFFGAVCIVFGLLTGFGVVSSLTDPNFTVNINGVERNDAEAKMLALFFPILMIVIGIVLNLISFNDVSNINKARDAFWTIFRK